MPVRLTAKEVKTVLQRHGFVCVSQKGAVTIVPFHSGRHLPIGTLYSIIRASGIDKTEFGF